MRKLSHFVLLLLLLSAAAIRARAADVIDRIVATVNGHVILQSDWDDAVRFEALAEGRPLDRITDQDRSRALDRLVDQELVREQAQGADAPQPPAEEIQQRIQEIQKQHSATAAADWRSALARYALDQKQVEAWIAHDISILHQVEARLRPAVQITPQTIESYYQGTFLPQLRKAGAQDVPLAQVSGKIREILTEQKVNELFSSWLQSLRSESKINVPGPASSPPAPAGGQGQ
jgi:peptidyl-prolyl cis-trans isomerase SurA